MFSRLGWLLYGRWAERRRTLGFRAGALSYARGTRFSGWNVLHGKAAVANSTLGRFSYLSSCTVIDTDIGAFTSIAPEARIGGLGRHPTTMASTHPAFYSARGQAGRSFADQDYFEESARTRVGSDVWIGARAVVLDGITIGDGAIVAAGSIVTKDVAPYAIVGGVPARVIRYRFSLEEISDLLRVKWWEWPIEELQNCAPLFRNSPISDLITYAERQRRI